MGKVEYRTSSGQAFEIAANGHLVAPVINLRSLGCPDWLATKVENAREHRSIRERAATAMSKGTVATPSDEEIRRKAAAIGEQVAADKEELRREDEMREKMRIASGRTTR